VNVFLFCRSQCTVPFVVHDIVKIHTKPGLIDNGQVNRYKKNHYFYGFRVYAYNNIMKTNCKRLYCPYSVITLEDSIAMSVRHIQLAFIDHCEGGTYLAVQEFPKHWLSKNTFWFSRMSPTAPALRETPLNSTVWDFCHISLSIFLFPPLLLYPSVSHLSVSANVQKVYSRRKNVSPHAILGETMIRKYKYYIEIEKNKITTHGSVDVWLKQLNNN